MTNSAYRSQADIAPMGARSINTLGTTPGDQSSRLQNMTMGLTSLVRRRPFATLGFSLFAGALLPELLGAVTGAGKSTSPTPAAGPLARNVQGTAADIAGTAQSAVSGVTNTAANVASDVADTTQSAVSGVTRTASNVASDVADSTQSAVSRVAATTQDAAATVAGTGQDAVSTAASTASNVASTVVDTTQSAAATAVDTATGVASTVADTAQSAAVTVADTAQSAAETVVGTAASATSAVVDTTTQVAQNVAQTTMRATSNLVETVQDLGAQAVDAVSNLGTTVNRQLQQRPLGALGVSIGAGALLQPFLAPYVSQVTSGLQSGAQTVQRSVGSTLSSITPSLDLPNQPEVERIRAALVPATVERSQKFVSRDLREYLESLLEPVVTQTSVRAAIVAAVTDRSSEFIEGRLPTLLNTTLGGSRALFVASALGTLLDAYTKAQQGEGKTMQIVTRDLTQSLTESSKQRLQRYFPEFREQYQQLDARPISM